MLYTSPWSRFELTTSVVIGTDCIGSCKSNYHMITATRIAQTFVVVSNLDWLSYLCHTVILDIDQLITIGGMVIRTTSLIPEMREAFFKCYVCGNTASVEIDRGRIAEPTLCTNCNTNHSFALVHNRSQFTDKQMVKLQESPGI